MKHNIIAAIIIAVGLIVAAFLFTGRYYLVRLDEQTLARLDRWTGHVKVYDCSSPWFCDDTPTTGVSGVDNAITTMNVDETLTMENVVTDNSVR